MFNFIWFDELFPDHFLIFENLATYSILTTKKVSSCYVKQNNKMSWNAKRSTETTIRKGLYQVSKYQVSLSTFFSSCWRTEKKIVIIFWEIKTRQRLQNELYSLIYYWSVNSSFQHIQKGSPLSPIHIVDSFVVDIVMPSCSLEESDPLKFISSESLPDSNGSNLHGCIWTLPNKTSGSWSILYIG